MNKMQMVALLAKIANRNSKELSGLLNCTHSDVMTFFSKLSGIKAATLESSLISGQLVTRTLLIDMVEALETVTKRPLTADCSQPLKYLDEGTTFGDIADYFSASGSQKINLIRAKIFQPKEKSLEEEIALFRVAAAAAYAFQIGKPINDEFYDLKVMEQHPEDFGTSSEWDLAVGWAEDEMNMQISHLLGEKISPESTVKDLLDLLCDEKKKMLLKKAA